MIKDIKDSHLCVLSHTTPHLQPAKLSSWKRTVKKRGWGWKELHRIRGLGTNFLTLFTLSSLNQAVVDHPSLCPVKNNHITFDDSVCLMEVLAESSSSSWTTPVSDMAGGWPSNLTALCIALKWLSLFQVHVQFFRFLSLYCGLWAYRGLCELMAERHNGARDPHVLSSGSCWAWRIPVFVTTMM